MNQIAKDVIRTKLITAMAQEKLTATGLAKKLDTRHEYIGKLRNQKYDAVPGVLWEKLRDWTNSGMTLEKFADKKSEKDEDPVQETKAKEPNISEKMKWREQAASLQIALDIAKKKIEGYEQGCIIPEYLKEQERQQETMENKQMIHIDIILRINGKEIRL